MNVLVNTTNVSLPFAVSFLNYSFLSFLTLHNSIEGLTPASIVILLSTVMMVVIGLFLLIFFICWRRKRMQASVLASRSTTESEALLRAEAAINKTKDDEFYD